MRTLTPHDWETIHRYRDLFDELKVWRELTWRGHDVAKIPNDLWLYQEVIFDLKPALIVEFGTNEGGSALFFADMMDLNDFGRVLTIDIKVVRDLPMHDRIEYFIGHSRHDRAVEAVTDAVAKAEGPVMFIEDSTHNREHVAGELELYGKMVTPGSYFVVEDCGWPDQTMDVQDAIADFVRENPDFAVDESKGKFLMTLAPGGWVRRSDK